MASDLKNILKDYIPVMYKAKPRKEPYPLATGDIFHLDAAFFKKYSKYPEILTLFESFSENKDYTSNLWAILNKPCDMVYDVPGNRLFEDNLIICPLRNFLSSFDSDGPLYDCVQKKSSELVPQLMIKNTYENFCNSYLNANYKVSGTTIEKETIIALRKELKIAMLSYFAEIFSDTEIMISEIEALLTKVLETELQERLNVLQLEDFIVFLGSDAKWISYKGRVEKEKISSKEIIIKGSKRSKISNLTLNQMDSKGLFYFEPHKKLISKNEFSYLIELQELITWKIKDKEIKSGGINEALIQRRVLSLADNFSDRLLNIMGNYFSKIGTYDVSSANIVKLYEDAFSSRFKVVDEE